MEGKTRQNGFNAPITVGFVGHITVDSLNKLKTTIESIHDFELVFFKTTSGKLWIKEGDE